MTTYHSDIGQDVLMTVDEVRRHFRLKSYQTIYNWIKTEGFPPPMKLGGSSRWKLSQVVEWSNSRHSKE